MYYSPKLFCFTYQFVLLIVFCNSLLYIQIIFILDYECYIFDVFNICESSLLFTF